MTSAAAALGFVASDQLGDVLRTQVQDQTEEERKKRLAGQLFGGLAGGQFSPATSALIGGLS